MNEAVQFIQDGWGRVEVRAVLAIVGSVIVAKVLDWILCRVIRRLTRRTNTDLDDRLMLQLHRPIFVSVVLYGIYFATRMVDLDPTIFSVILGLIHTILVVVWTGALLRIVSILLEGVNTLAQRVSWIEARTVPLFDNLAKLVILGGAVYCLLLAWKLDVKPWLASAGIAGIAIGFAAKDTLANIFGGLFVIADSPYQLGDFINLDSGERGMVTKIGLRSTRLLTRDDVEITLPNAVIANAKIVNESGGRWPKLRVSINVGVAYDSDVDQVHRVLFEAAQSVEFVVKDPEPRIRFMEMGDSALIFRVQVWTDEPVNRGRCIDALNTTVFKRLKAEQITIPFPQRVVYLHSADAPVRA